MGSKPPCLLPVPPAPHFPCCTLPVGSLAPRVPPHLSSSPGGAAPFGFARFLGNAPCTPDAPGAGNVGFIRAPPSLQCLSLPPVSPPDCSPHTFGVPLPQVIANDRACRQLQEAVGRSRRLCLEVETTVTRFRAQRQKRLGMGTSCIRAPDGGFPEEPLSPSLLDKSSWSQRRVWSPKWAGLVLWDGGV